MDAIDDLVIRDLYMENLYTALSALPEKQKKRFVLYFEYNLTYKQISEIESCTPMAIKKSIDLAKKSIIEALKSF